MAVLAGITQGMFYCDRTASLGSAVKEEAPIEKNVKSDYALVTRHNSKATQCKNMLAFEFQVHSMQRSSDLGV